MSVQRWLGVLILALFLSLVLSGPAHAQTKPTAALKTPLRSNGPAFSNKSSLQTTVLTKKEIKKLKGTWNLRLQQRRFEDAFNQRSFTEFRLLADLQYYPVEEIYFRLAPKFSYTNGFFQSQKVGSENQSTWGVKEASINAEISAYFKASLGALSQEEVHPSILLDDQAFASARVTAQTNSENPFVASLIGETAIPTSSSLSTQTKEFEKTPSFQSASLVLKAQTVVETWIQIGVYEFQNLPMSVATNSSFLGNTTLPTSGTDSIFKYEYKGPFASGEIKAPLGKHLALGGSAEWIKNDQAPSSLNQGTTSKAFAQIQAGRNFMLEPFYEFFRIEPDASVAHYNGDWLSTNRVGYNSGFSLMYKKIMRLKFSSGERDVVYTTPFQQRERTWYLRLETFDVAI